MDGQFRALEFNSSAVTQEVSGCNHMQTPPLINLLNANIGHTDDHREDWSEENLHWFFTV